MTGSLRNRRQLLGNDNNRGFAVGDVDGDGDLDAFVANSYGPNRVWLNDGSGSFQATGEALGNSFSFDLDVGDLDGDGQDEIVSGFRGQGFQLSIYQAADPQGRLSNELRMSREVHQGPSRSRESE